MFQLSKEGLEAVKKEITRYESKQSAVIPALYIAQKENKGWVSPEVIEHLSKVMEIPVAQIQEVFSFYTMFNKSPVGKYHVQVCCNISCSMANARELTDHCLQKLGVEEGDVSSDGRFTISRAECLGSCDTAPMAQINDNYYENLTIEKMDKLLEELR